MIVQLRPIYKVKVQSELYTVQHFTVQLCGRSRQQHHGGTNVTSDWGNTSHYSLYYTGVAGLLIRVFITCSGHSVLWCHVNEPLQKDDNAVWAQELPQTEDFVLVCGKDVVCAHIPSSVQNPQNSQ